MPTPPSPGWPAHPPSRAVGTWLAAPAHGGCRDGVLATVGEEPAEVGDPDRDQQRGQRREHRQRIGQVARVAHPYIGEDGGANRGGEDDGGGDDRRPLLVLE